jgi:hypothetical protein
MTPDIFGRRCGDCYAFKDRDTSCWKTCQGTFPWASEMSSLTLTSSGMMRSGELFPLRAHAEPHTSEGGSLSWPTPAAVSYGTNQGGGMGRVGPVRESLETTARKEGGSLNPDWVCALMGFPIGWAKPDGPPLRGTLNTTGSHPEPAKDTPDESLS